MPVFNNILAGAAGQGGSGSYKIEKSIRLFSNDGSHFDRTPSTQGNRSKWTWSGWIKLTGDGDSYNPIWSAGNNPWTGLHFLDNTLRCVLDAGVGEIGAITDAVFRDAAAWYSIICSVNTGESNASDRIKFWINGLPASHVAGANGYPSQNYQSVMNTTIAHRLGADGRVAGGGVRHGNMLMADVHFLDGIAISDPNGVFGEFNADTGEWDPIAYTGNYNGPADGLGGVTWSSYVTGSVASSYPLSKCFGGTIGTGYVNGTRSTNPGSLTLNISAVNLNVTNVRLSTFLSGSPTLTVNGTNVSITGSGDQTHVVAVNGQLNSVVWSYDSSNGPYCYMRGIEVDLGDGSGYRLLTDGAGAPGGSNGFHLNFSDNSTQAALGTDTSGLNNNLTVNSINSVTGPFAASGYRENTGSTNQSWNNSSAASATSSLVNEDTIFWVDLGYQVYTDLITFDVEITGTDTNANNYFVYYTTDPASTGTNTFNTFNRTPGGTTGSFSMALTSASTITGRYFGVANGNGGTSAQFKYSNFKVHPVGKNTDVLLDSPTSFEPATGNAVGNYATWNKNSERSSIGVQNGGLDATTTLSGSGYVLSTIPLSSGKFYCEIAFEGTMSHNTNYMYVGIVPANSAAHYNNNDIFRAEGALGIDSQSTYIRGVRGTGSSDAANTYQSSYGFDENDVIGIAIDCDTPQVTFYKNGVSIGTYPHAMMPNQSWLVYCNDWANGADITKYIFNAGQRAFSFEPPAGFKSMCTQNLEDPLIKKSSEYFQTTVYSGNGSARNVTTTGMSPDLVWIKNRSSGSWHHLLCDANRGSNNRLIPNLTNTQDNGAGYGVVNSFNSDGFGIDGGGGNINSAGSSYVAWSWETGSSNTAISAGSLNSTAVDQSQTWSNGVGATRGGDPATNAFNGNPGNEAAANGTSLAWTVSLTNVTSMHIKCRSSNGSSSPYLTVSGTGINDLIIPGNRTGEVAEISVTNSSVSNLTVTTSDQNALAPGICQVFVNGKELVDSGNGYDLPSRASTTRANPTSGCSIITYSGAGSTATYAHNLNQPPELVIIKALNKTDDWRVYHKNVGAGSYLRLQDTFAATSTGNWKSINSTTICINSDSAINGSGYNYVAYCFAPVKQFSAFGHFKANANSDGPVVTLDFKPEFILVKKSNNTSGWMIIDATRDPHNVAKKFLQPNVADAEGSSADRFDILSNGFKVRAPSAYTPNESSGDTYVYAAWASAPFKYARAR